MNPGERAPRKLLMRGFGVRVPGGAPVLTLPDLLIPCSGRVGGHTLVTFTLALSTSSSQGCRERIGCCLVMAWQYMGVEPERD